VDLQTLSIDRTKKPAAARRRGNPWPLRIVVVGALGAAAWLFWPSLSGFVDRMRLPEVKTFVVTEPVAAAAAAVRGTAANGYVVAARRAALSSDVPGRIVAMEVREGSVVKKGDIVARLFADEYRAAWQKAVADAAAATAGVQRAAEASRASEAELAQAEAATVTASAQRDEAKAQSAWLQNELRRAEDLLHQGIGSERDVERARLDLDGSRARLAAQEALVASSETAVTTARQRVQVVAADARIAAAQADAAAAARDLAKATLDKTDVRAPFDGIVVLKDAEVGEVVSPNVQGGSNARGAVCTMVDFESLEVQANVPETTLESVQLGAPADVFLDAYPERRYAGTVDRIWPTADRQKATVEVRVKLAERDDRLRPEMGVRIVFRKSDGPVADASANGTQSPRAVLVPEPAIVEQGGAAGAFVVERDTVRFVAVTTGQRKNGRVAIEKGLVAGQRVVLDPPPSLADGARVRLADP